jgi:hypothetical protein
MAPRQRSRSLPRRRQYPSSPHCTCHDQIIIVTTIPSLSSVMTLAYGVRAALADLSVHCKNVQSYLSIYLSVNQPKRSLDWIHLLNLTEIMPIAAVAVGERRSQPRCEPFPYTFALGQQDKHKLAYYWLSRVHLLFRV